MPSLGGRWSARGTSRVACPERAAADAGLQPTAEHAVVALYPHSTDQICCLGAAEMGQATRRELALGLRSAEASLAATRGRSRWRRGGAGARETQRRRLPSALGALDLLSRLGPRAETASMLRRSLPFLPTLLAISSSNARAQPTSPPARLAGRRPSPADLAGQAVRLRGLPQASPQVCKGVAYCSKDCQVCVASHPACALSRPLAQETGKHDQVTRTTMSALHDKALARMLMLAQGCESFRLLLSRGEKVVYYET